jgi:hypothetical protein
MLTAALEHHLNPLNVRGGIMRKLIATAVFAAFCVAGSPSYAQFGAVKDGAKKAGSVTKDVGEATVDTAKKGVDATEKGAKKVVQSTYRCNDGKTDKATLKENACKDHGGVKPEPKKAK